jgi:GDP-D-mannose 3', 5'-epimerase
MTMDRTISPTDPILVAGAGGFIGGWVVRYLRDTGFETIRAVDIKPFDEWYQRFDDVENRVDDLRSLETCQRAVDGIAHVYNLACDMGGMGFIEANRAACMVSVLINTHLLMAGKDAGVKRHFLSSSACVYNIHLQQDAAVTALREEDAYPAMPEDGYGWEKLFSERMCRNFRDDFGIETRIARYHNVYGPHGTYDGDLPEGGGGEAVRSTRDRDLGRRRADPQLHVHRRLPDRHDEDHGERHPRPDQPGLRRTGHHQPAR